MGIHPKASFQVYNQAWVASFFLPLKPRYFSSPAATSCTHHGFRKTQVLGILADSPVVKQTQTTCKPDFRSCIHLQFFWEKKNSPWFTHESTWQSSHCYGAISQTTVLWSLFFFPSSYSLAQPTNFPSSKGTTQHSFSKLSCVTATLV